MWNFIGLNISAVATLMYIIITFGEKGKNSPAKTSPKVIPRDEKNIPKKDGSDTLIINVHGSTKINLKHSLISPKPARMKL